MTTYIVVYGCCLKKFGVDCIDYAIDHVGGCEESIARCGTAVGAYIEIARRRRQKAMILTAGGRTKDCRMLEVPNLSDAMWHDLIKFFWLEPREVRLTMSPDGTNTLRETLVALEELRRLEFNPEQDEIIAVSSWFHLPRIWLIWRLLGIRVKIYGARAYHRGRWLLEPLKVVKAVVQVIGYYLGIRFLYSERW